MTYLGIIITAVATIVSAVVGCGGFWEWRRTRREHAAQAVTQQDLNDIRETLHRVEESVTANAERLRAHEAETHAHRLLGLRQAMMAEPHDRIEHEHQLDAGREYLASGGNGIGHMRYDQLEACYQWRLAHGDWDYTHKPPDEILDSSIYINKGDHHRD